MTFDDARVRLVPGSGVVIRLPGLVGLVFPASDAHQPLVTAFLDALRAASGQPDAGRRAARATAGLLAGTDDGPPLGLVGVDGAGLAVLLYGDVEFAHRDPGGDEVLSGRDAAAWLDRLLDHVPAQWSLARGGSGAADEWSDLPGGAARADGLATGMVEAAAVPPPPVDAPPETAPAPAAGDASLEAEETAEEVAPPPEVPTPPPDEPAPAPVPATDFESVPLDAPPAEEPEREPLPVVAGSAAPPPAAPAAGDEPEAPLVHGVICARGHFNDPTSPFCATCGISMVQQTHNLVEGPRPPLGVLVLDDGSTYVVDRDVIIGRQPEADEHTRAITLPDPERSISRNHARVTLEGWEARIVDNGSANGTFVAARSATTWTPVPAGNPVALTPGMHVLVGQRVLSFDTHRRG